MGCISRDSSPIIGQRKWLYRACLKVRIFPLNMRDIIIYVPWWWEKYLSKRSPLKHTCSRRDKFIALLFPMFVETLQFVVFGFACWFSLWYNSKLCPDLFCISLWSCLAALNFFFGRIDYFSRCDDPFAKWHLLTAQTTNLLQ